MNKAGQLAQNGERRRMRGKDFCALISCLAGQFGHFLGSKAVPSSAANRDNTYERNLAG